MTAARERRVLVVEDSATQAEALRFILEGAGFGVDVAGSAEAALERLEQAGGGAFDFVVSDIVMPGLSGYELCQRIKHDPRWSRLPVLLLTSLTDPLDVIRALESGADSFLGKACEPEQLIGRVHGLLESRRLRALAAGAPGVDVWFGGARFTVPSEKEQILDLLVSTFEDMVHKNEEAVTARDALAEKHARLLQVEQQKDELSALVVHDLKSPAAGIMMAAQMRLRSGGLSDMDRQLWGLVYTSAEVINRMVLNLLDIASSDDGAFTPRRGAVDVPALVAEVQRIMTPVADSLGHRIVVELRAMVPTLHADPDLLRRVLQNLVDNALRHSPRGTVVQIEAVPGPSQLALRVRDHGPGVPAELRERIFDRYVRISPGTGPGGGPGKGLGLAFCRIAVEAHGGRVWVEDNQPRGSVFVVELPLDPNGEVEVM
jgi:signal transduction histidine kinase